MKILTHEEADLVLLWCDRRIRPGSFVFSVFQVRVEDAELAASERPGLKIKKVDKGDKPAAQGMYPVVVMPAKEFAVICSRQLYLEI
jgi:hypothetical protein